MAARRPSPIRYPRQGNSPRYTDLVGDGDRLAGDRVDRRWPAKPGRFDGTSAAWAGWVPGGRFALLLTALWLYFRVAITNRLVFNPLVGKLMAKYGYAFAARRLGTDEVLFSMRRLWAGWRKNRSRAGQPTTSLIDIDRMHAPVDGETPDNTGHHAMCSATVKRAAGGLRVPQTAVLVLAPQLASSTSTGA